MSCVPFLIDGNPVEKLTLSWEGPTYFVMMLRHVAQGTSHVTHLDVEFDPHHPRLLTNSASALSHLYRLRLREVSWVRFVVELFDVLTNLCVPIERHGGTSSLPVG